MVYNWDTMVAVKVPVGLNGWQNRGTVIINGRKFLFPVGVETMVPEPVAFYIDLMIRLEEENNRPPSAPPENEDGECDCVVSIIESASPKKEMLGEFAVLGPVQFPNAENIGNDAFENCDYLTSVDLPVATSVGANAFIVCNSLTSVNLPVATSIGSGAFAGCNSLTSVDLPVATSIGVGSFQSCTSLTSVNLPAAMIIDNDAFDGCTSLTSIDLPVATVVGNSAFDGCTSLTSVNLPVATIIGVEAFIDCNSLTSIDLPLVEYVNDAVFKNCTSLTSVDLPAATSIGADAFWGCPNFSVLILRTTDTVCSVDVTAILGTKIMTKEGILTGEGFIYIPASMDSAYRATYEPIFEQLGAPGQYDILFRKLEDYTVDGTATGKLDESKI